MKLTSSNMKFSCNLAVPNNIRPERNNKSMSVSTTTTSLAVSQQHHQFNGLAPVLDPTRGSLISPDISLDSSQPYLGFNYLSPDIQSTPGAYCFRESSPNPSSDRRLSPPPEVSSSLPQSSGPDSPLSNEPNSLKSIRPDSPQSDGPNSAQLIEPDSPKSPWKRQSPPNHLPHPDVHQKGQISEEEFGVITSICMISGNKVTDGVIEPKTAPSSANYASINQLKIEGFTTNSSHKHYVREISNHSGDHRRTHLRKLEIELKTPNRACCMKSPGASKTDIFRGGIHTVETCSGRGTSKNKISDRSGTFKTDRSSRRQFMKKFSVPNMNISRRSIDIQDEDFKPDPERFRRRLARARERRATLVLGIVMASFIGCWLPFFLMYPITLLVGGFDIPPMVFAVIFWLGYCNSALNPIIYTIFNREFRAAFKRILTGILSSMGLL